MFFWFIFLSVFLFNYTYQLNSVHAKTAVNILFLSFCKLQGNGLAQSVQYLTTDWTNVVRSPTEQTIFPVASVSRPDLKPTLPPIQRVPGVLPGGKLRPGRDADH
jgi:hypothetical protein